jgi:hypothetical protein
MGAILKYCLNFFRMWKLEEQLLRPNKSTTNIIQIIYDRNKDSESEWKKLYGCGDVLLQ